MLLLPFLFGVTLGAAVMYALCDLWWAQREPASFNRRPRWFS